MLIDLVHVVSATNTFNPWVEKYTLRVEALFVDYKIDVHSTFFEKNPYKI